MTTAVNPGNGEMLIRVKAAGVGPWDAWIGAGKSVLPPLLPLTLGSDISGVVEVVGAGVIGFAPGDEVFGVTNPRFTGGYADYAVASAAMLTGKPATISRVSARCGGGRVAGAVRAAHPWSECSGAWCRRQCRHLCDTVRA